MTFIQRTPNPVHLALLGLGLASVLAGCAAPSGDALARHATRAAAAGEWSEAAKHWNDVLRLRGEGDVEGTLGYAAALCEMGQTPLARLVLERAVNRTPRYEQAPFWMGLAALEAELGQQDAQVRALESALESDPELVAGWLALGHHFKDAGQTRKALDHFTQAATFDPNHAQAFEQMAPLARDLDLPKVEFHVLRARLALGTAGTPMVMRAIELSFLPEVIGQYGDCRDDRFGWLQIAVQQDPQAQRAHYLLGVHHLEHMDAQDADPWLTRAAELDPGDADALDALIRCLRETGQDARASSVLDHALRVTPESEHDRFRSLTIE